MLQLWSVRSVCSLRTTAPVLLKGFFHHDIVNHSTTTKGHVSRRVFNPSFRYYSNKASSKHRVSVIGSGNWGSVVARIVGQNVLKFPHLFDEKVRIWVFEEELVASDEEIKASFHLIDKSGDGMSVKGIERLAQEVGIDLPHVQAAELIRIIEGDTNSKITFENFKKWWKSSDTTKRTRKLTQIVNRLNENIKYLPGVKLGYNVVAESQLLEAVKDASVLVFVTPHQFTMGICRQLKGHIDKDSKAISLTKGMEIDENGFHLMSDLIKKELGIDCSVLMGANIANEIAMERFSEATIGYSIEENGKLFQQLFNTPYFQVRIIDDVSGPEMCGTLKNIVAIGAGFVDGLKLGNNSKAAIIRIGLQEMIKLSKMCFPNVKDATFFESCGMADLVTTCFGGRNRKCAEAFVLANGTKTFDEIEAELLGGQKLQGVLTSREVHHVLKHLDKVDDFPLFTTINRIINGHLEPIQIVDYADLPKTRDDMSPQARDHE